MEKFRQQASAKEEFSYGSETHYIYNVLDQYSIKGDMGIVLGSEVPWVEGILLSKGALDFQQSPTSRIVIITFIWPSVKFL